MTNPAHPGPTTGALWRFVRRFVVLSLLWWVLTGGRVDAWIIGVPTAALAAVVSMRLAGEHKTRWRPLGLLRFVCHFLRWSFLGGVDVAWRAVHPRLPIEPQNIDYPMRLPDGPARVFFMGVVSLLPGTVTADIRGDVLVVHVLDAGQPVRRHLEALEESVGGVFGVAVK